MADVKVTDADTRIGEFWGRNAFERETIASEVAKVRAEGFAAGMAAERERIAAGLSDLASDLKRDSEGGRGLAGGHIESIALALRATGEVRG